MVCAFLGWLACVHWLRVSFGAPGWFPYGVGLITVLWFRRPDTLGVPYCSDEMRCFTVAF